MTMLHIRALTTLLPQPIRFNLRRLAFAGSAVTCVLCGNSVRGFTAHGGGAEVLERRRVVGGMRREQDCCPVCRGRDRCRMVMLYLADVSGVGKGPRTILHVAPDFGLYLWLQRKSGVTYFGTDINGFRYRHIDNMRTADLAAMPFEAAQFDVVICSHVLEHVPDDLKAMHEILRVLKPGGEALLPVPMATDGETTCEDPSIVKPAERHRHFGQWDHVRIYGRDDFLKRTEAAGFETSVFLPFERFPDQAEALRLNPLEFLPVCRKPVT